jgi:2-dehydro-3-deoxyphosphogluconate aldolase/(4S)-4-hydroxy-2-oxoglutarate aldolase
MNRVEVLQKPEPGGHGEQPGPGRGFRPEQVDKQRGTESRTAPIQVAGKASEPTGSCGRGVQNGRDGDDDPAGLESPRIRALGTALPPPAGGWERPLNLRGVLLRYRLIPTARLSAAEDAVPLAAALQRAGLPLLQVSLATAAALPAIEAIRAALPDFLVGAGSVLSPGQVNDAMAAGARFGSGPAMHPGLLAAALSAEFPFLPGAMTPSEIECGIQWGFLTQCFYPAAAAGGPAMVRALAGPYRHTPLVLVPAGGLRTADFQQYLAIPEVGAVAGRFLCEGALIEAGLWEDIEAQAVLCMRKAAAAVRERLGAPQYEAPEGDGPEEIYR